MAGISPIKLENWATVTSKDCYCRAEEQELFDLHLIGNVYGHEKFDDGTRVYTSSIRGFDGKQVITGSSHYVLGEPDKKYLELFPNAYERFIKLLVARCCVGASR